MIRLKAIAILYVECKTNTYGINQNFSQCCYGHYMTNLNKQNMLRWKHFVSLPITLSLPSISHSFKYFLKTFTIILLYCYYYYYDVLNKVRYQHNTSSLHVLALTIEFDEPKRCQHMIISLIPNNHKEIPHQIQFPAHHKKSVKIN